MSGDAEGCVILIVCTFALILAFIVGQKAGQRSSLTACGAAHYDSITGDFVMDKK